MDSSLEINWLIQLGDGMAADGSQYLDRCNTVNYDSERNQVIALLEASSPSLRPESYSDDVKLGADILILKISKSGKIQDAYNINNDKANQVINGIDFPEMFYLSYNSGLYKDGSYIFGVQSFGFRT